jgi:hypothetical protein
MNTNTAINLYAELGKLLYAVADTDHAVSDKEKMKLLEIVKNELIPRSKQTDRYGTNIARYTQFEFEILDEDIAGSETAFDSFLAYYDTHRDSFTPEMKHLILKIVSELAKSYYGSSNKENELIVTLIKKLQEIPKL